MHYDTRNSKNSFMELSTKGGVFLKVGATAGRVGESSERGARGPSPHISNWKTNKYNLQFTI